MGCNQRAFYERRVGVLRKSTHYELGEQRSALTVTVASTTEERFLEYLKVRDHRARGHGRGRGWEIGSLTRLEPVVQAVQEL